ncbi:hypothetical protein EPIR_1848 [Erwinia piriflorinigrans CFBP 5888]|uniref:Uncharacterized protein n=1 Tax=Erwinia piriflorinigrans CFBP 5888 TaxID=1161919 RepID=V5Z8D3_9GAMM|nr:hypothetical protein EPIR_1848 [Erwinia piriflorinigrans CFBP 5888]
MVLTFLANKKAGITGFRVGSTQGAYDFQLIKL